MRLPRVCLQDGCPEICDPGDIRCATHKRKAWQGPRTASSLETSGSAWRRIRLQVLRRDNYICHYCGAPATVVDHVKAVARGGKSSLDNLVAACSPCNSAKGGR